MNKKCKVTGWDCPYEFLTCDGCDEMEDFYLDIDLDELEEEE